MEEDYEERPEPCPDQMRDEMIDRAMFCETQEEADSIPSAFRRYLPTKFRYRTPSKPRAGVVNEGFI